MIIQNSLQGQLGNLAKSSEAQLLNIADLLMDDALQVRHKLDEGAIRRYLSAYKAGTPLPPIKVAIVDGKVLTIVDGWHRITALQRLGRGQVEAFVIACPNRNDAAWLAAEANMQHGVPLKPSELRNVFKAYIKAGRYLKKGKRLKSWREIGTDLGKSHQTIGTWMAKDFPKLHRQYASEHLSRPTGGHTNASVNETSKEVCDRLLNGAAAALKGVTDREDRIELAVKLRKMAGLLADVSQAEIEAYQDVDF